LNLFKTETDFGPKLSLSHFAKTIVLALSLRSNDFTFCLSQMTQRNYLTSLNVLELNLSCTLATNS